MSETLFELRDPDEMLRTARLSEDGVYRWTLHRIWGSCDAVAWRVLCWGPKKTGPRRAACWKHEGETDLSAFRDDLGGRDLPPVIHTPCGHDWTDQTHRHECRFTMDHDGPHACTCGNTRVLPPGGAA